MGVFAEFERAMIRDRMKAGLANARAKGVRLGAPRTDAKANANNVRGLSATGRGVLTKRIFDSYLDERVRSQSIEATGNDGGSARFVTSG